MTHDNLRAFISDIIESNNSINIFDSIEKLGCYFETSLDFKNEISDKAYATDVPLIKNIETISRGRNLFSMTLKYISKLNDIPAFSDVSQDFIVSSNKWKLIKAILVKAYFQSSLNESQIADLSNKIKEIAKFEKEIEHTLFQIMINKYTKCYNLNKSNFVNSKRNSKLNNDIIYLELEKYFNNNAYGIQYLNKETANLTGNGEFFLNKKLPDNEIWNIENMRFRFPKILEGQNDNISCKGQIIYVPENIYDSIMFLGCSEYGNFSDNAVLNLVNGENYNLLISFTDWVWNPVFDEQIAWKGIGTKIKDGNIEEWESMLFAKEYTITVNKAIKYIVLPDCPNMHVFAISLYKK